MKTIAMLSLLAALSIAAKTDGVNAADLPSDAASIEQLKDFLLLFGEDRAIGKNISNVIGVPSPSLAKGRDIFGSETPDAIEAAACILVLAPGTAQKPAPTVIYLMHHRESGRISE